MIGQIRVGPVYGRLAIVISSKLVPPLQEAGNLRNVLDFSHFVGLCHHKNSCPVSQLLSCLLGIFPCPTITDGYKWMAVHLQNDLDCLVS